MKTRHLLSAAAALLLSANAMAQTDITPSRYVFAEQPVGKYTIDMFNGGANPAAPNQPVIDNWNNGFVMLAGAPPIYTPADGKNTQGAETLQSGLTIVDLGGEVGKVLCFKGAESTYSYGTAMDGSFTDLRWYNLNFYTDPTNTPNVEKYKGEGMSEDAALAKAKIRVRLVFSFVQNTLDQINTVTNFYASTFSNDVVPAGDNGKHTNFRSGDFCQVYEDDGSPVEDDNGDMIYDPTRWMIYEFDTWVNAATGAPTRIKMEMMNDILKTGALFIKELSFTTDVTGDPVQRQYLKLTPNPTGMAPSLNADKPLYSLNGRSVVFADAARVYTLSGIEVAKAAVNAPVELAPGFYLAKVGEKSVKLIIK